MPIDNTALLRELIARRQIAIRDAPILHAPVRPVCAANLRDRVEGMLLGLAIGDALGNTTESMNPEERSAVYDEIRDYRPNRHVEGRRVGLPSDDTQMAFWTLRRLNEDGGLVPVRVAREFCSHRILGIGRSVLDFTRRFKSGSMNWVVAASRSAGNGALMRIAPVLVPHLSAPSPALRADAAIAATITHHDTASTAGCVAFVMLLWELLSCDAAPEPAWWVDTFTDGLRPLELDTTYRPRKPDLEWTGRLSAFIDGFVRPALAEGIDARAASDRWHSGAYLLETVPSALFILARYGHDPEEAIVRAVNDTRDNDTVAAIVGAAVGALHGRAALPSRWIAQLLGRTDVADDGEVFRLIDEAVRLWVPAAS